MITKTKKNDFFLFGLELVNANVSGGMAQLMNDNQETYVPSLAGDPLCPVSTHGDQSFEERSRNVK